MATLAALIAEVNRDKQARAKPYSPKEFMPDFDTEPEPVDFEAQWKAQKAAMMALTQKPPSPPDPHP